MLKKTISSMLIIIILALSMPMQTFVEVFTSYAVTTTWKFEYTGEKQTFEVPYKGIYKIEAYGAQGESYNNYIGGKGGSVSANILFQKADQLTINVGGKGNIFNGGGNGSTSKGGGATDIRLNGTSLENRIIVAGGGGAASPEGNGNPGSDSNNLTNELGNGGSGQIGGGGGYYRRKRRSHNIT